MQQMKSQLTTEARAVVNIPYDAINNKFYSHKKKRHLIFLWLFNSHQSVVFVYMLTQIGKVCLTGRRDKADKTDRFQENRIFLGIWAAFILSGGRGATEEALWPKTLI